MKGWLIAAGVAALAFLGVKKTDTESQPVDTSGGVINQNTSMAASEPNPFNNLNIAGIKSSNSEGVVNARTNAMARSIENLQRSYAGGGTNVESMEKNLAAKMSGSHRNWKYIESDKQAAYQKALSTIIAKRPDSANAVLAKQKRTPAGLGGENRNTMR